MQANSIRNGLIILIAFVVAVWLGVTIVTEQTETILKITTAALLLTCVFLGRRIWLLLIFFAALNVPLIRGFGTTELGQTLFIGFTVLMTLMRRQQYKISFGEKEIWMLLLAGSILQVFLRNPVGLGLFGAGEVGAKPYFMATMSFLSAMILGNILIRPSELKWVLRLSILGSFLGIALTTLRMRGVGAEGFKQGGTIDDGRGSTRIGTLGELGNATSRVVVAFVSPLKGLFHPLWAPVIIFCLVAAAGSGYRTMVATVGMTLITGIAYRGGFAHVLFACLSSAFLLGVIAIVNVTSPLPPNVQRALSPFPGTWEKRHVEAADQSTEWRVEMWKEALFTDYWINDKILGDGLGFTRRELLMMEDMSTGGSSTLDNRGSGMSAQMEAMMVTGGYHSGPVQSVRTVGYVGLAILLLAMFRMAVHAHRQMLRCRGTEWFPLSLYFGIPAIVLPVIFIFVFGDFGRDVSAVFFSYGMISLLEKNLPLPPYRKARYVPYILNRSRPTAEAQLR